MTPKQLRALIKKHDGNIVYKQYKTFLYGVSPLSTSFARLVEREDKLYLEVLSLQKTCREELALDYLYYWSGRKSDYYMIEDRTVTDVTRWFSPKNSVIFVLHGYDFGNLKEGIEILNHYEKEAKWGTTSVTNLGSFHKNNGANIQTTLVISSRNWLRSIPHLSLFVLMLRVFHRVPKGNMSVQDYLNHIRFLSTVYGTSVGANKDFKYLNSFLDLHPKVIELFMKNTKTITNGILPDIGNEEFAEGIGTLTDLVKLLNIVPSAKTTITYMHARMCKEFAKIIKEAT